MRPFLKVLRFAVEKNFLYLLSAFFVLFGCLQFMTGPAAEAGSAFGRTVMLLGILQVYELLLLVVGYSVYKRMGMDHDGLMLALITLLLLFDPTFFNNRVYTCADGLGVGTLANLILMGLALFKLYILTTSTRIPLAARTTAALAATAVVVYLAPLAVHAASEAWRPLLLLTGCLALPAIALGMARPRRQTEGRCPDRPWSELHTRFERYVYAVPLAILGFHAYELGLIYDVPWLEALLPSAILALGVVLMKTTWDLGRTSAVHTATAIGACLAAWGAASTLAMPAALAGWLTPLRLVLPAAAAYLAVAWSHTDERSLLWEAAALLTAAAAGGAPDQIVSTLVGFAPAPLGVLFLCLSAHAFLSEDPADYLVAGLSGSLFVARALPLTDAMSFYAFVQGAMLWTVVCHLRWDPEGLPSSLGTVATGTMTGLTWFYLEAGIGPEPVLAVVVHAQVALGLALWLLGGASWAAPAAVAGSLRFHAWPMLTRTGAPARALWELLGTWAGHGLLVAAFILLGLGFYVSINKERLLAGFETAER